MGEFGRGNRGPRGRDSRCKLQCLLLELESDVMLHGTITLKTDGLKTPSIKYLHIV